MRSIAEKAPWVAFLAIFPGFFIYHYLAGIELIPMFAGGWASFANLLTAMILAPMVGYAALRSGVALHVPFVAFILLILSYAAFHWRFGADYQRDSELLVHAVKLVLGLVALYCVGFLLQDAPGIKLAILAALLLMVLLTALRSDWSILMFDIPGRVVPSGRVSDYQGFATALAITAVLAIAIVRSPPWLLSVIVASAAALFLIGARGDMIGFGLAVCALAVFSVSRWEVKWAGLLVVAYAGVIAGLLIVPSLISPAPEQVVTPPVSGPVITPPESAVPKEPVGRFRILELLDVAESSSFGQRVEVLRLGWAGIKSSPIIGDYAGQVRDKGAFGWYIHNGLSAWQQFGLGGFVLYAALSLLGVGYSAWRVLIRGDRSFLMMATLLVSVYSVGLIFLTKSVFWPVPALAWGMAAARYRERRTSAI